jgi:lysozyme family protein
MIDTKGNKGPGIEGADPKGFLIFTDNGRISFQTIAAIPKLAKDRLVTTPEEDRAVAHAVLSYFGTYSVNEADRTFTIKIERSSYPNQSGNEVKRIVQSLSANELKFNNPARIGGGQTNLVWKRVK